MGARRCDAAALPCSPLLSRVARLASHTAGPDINQPRDPRNGRAGELVSEDPLLSGEYAVEYVRGCQEGEDPSRMLMLAGLKVMTCCYL